MSLSNTQYDEIIREYNALQIRNQHEVEAHKREVYSKDSRLKAIDDAIATCSLFQAKKMLNGDVDALEELRIRLEEYKQQHKAILNELGYDDEYFKPTYECPDCKDTGYIGSRRCHCFIQRAIDLVYTQSNIRSMLQEENFGQLSYDYYSRTDVNPANGMSSYDTMKNAVKECWKFIESFDFVFSNLFFYGDTGVGKTFLSSCIAKELLDTGHSVIYFSAFQLFVILEKNTFQKSSDADIIAAHQNIFECDLLIIDDLGTETPNYFTVSQLFLCLNERLLRRKSTIISTNLPLSQIAETYSERVFSRISSSYNMLKLFGDDIRIQKKLH